MKFIVMVLFACLLSTSAVFAQDYNSTYNLDTDGPISTFERPPAPTKYSVGCGCVDSSSGKVVIQYGQSVTGTDDFDALNNLEEAMRQCCYLEANSGGALECAFASGTAGGGPVTTIFCDHIE